MEVTKTNFKEVFPQVKQAIEECTFLAVDTELTGLHVEEKTHSFDTMEERYVKMCETAKNFLVIQVGISCFQYHESSKKYTHKDFNFYVFPRQECRHAPDTFFTCSASSLNFLTSNGFDFNKLLQEGVSYLTPSQEEKLHSSLKTSHEEELAAFTKQIDDRKCNASSPTIHVPDEHKDFIKDVHKKVDEYILSDSKEPLCLPPCSGYRRKLIYKTVLHKHSSGLSLSTTNKDGKSASITVCKLNDGEKLLQMKEKHISDMNDLKNAVGFRKVLDVVSSSKKLVLGHNMLLDLFHIVNQFYHPVPQTLSEFKEMLRCLFPHIADTKTLASSGLKSYGLLTPLFDLWEEIQNRPFPQPVIEPADGSACYDLETEKMHEAGFDAFMTGMVFISLIAKIAEDNKLNYIAPDHKILSPYVNRPYVMRHYDIQSLNLSGPDPEGNRDHVFYIMFPKEWKMLDLVELFLPFGEIHVSWLNDVSAFVVLKSPEQSINVRKSLLKNPSTIYKVWSYADYQEMQPVFKTPTLLEQKNRSSRFVNADITQKKKRSNSASIDGVVPNRSITPILEEEEESENSNMEKQDNCVSTSHDLASSPSENSRTGDSPKPKRQKIVKGDSENHEVSSTEKLFEESDTW